MDDILIVGVPQDIEDSRRKLNGAFKLKSMGAVRYLLGIEISYRSETVTFCQKEDVEDVLKVYGMADANAARIPMRSDSQASARARVGDGEDCRQDCGAKTHTVVGRNVQGPAELREEAHSAHTRSTKTPDARYRSSLVIYSTWSMAQDQICAPRCGC